MSESDFDFESDPAAPPPSPLLRSNIWPMATVVGAILLCGSLVWLEGAQRDSRIQVRNAIERVQDARIELARGFLEHEPPGEGNAEQVRGIRLALLEQAAASLGQAETHLRKKAMPGIAHADLDRLAAAIGVQRVRVLKFHDDVAASDRPTPGQYAEFRGIGREAEMLGAQLGAALSDLWRFQNRQGVTILMGAVVLLVLAGAGLYIGALQRQRAEAEVDNYRKHLEALVAQRSVALAASESRMRAFVGALPDVAFVLDRANRFVEVLTPASPHLYRGADTQVGRRISDVLPQPLAGRMQEIVRAALDRGGVQTLNYSLEFPDGERWFEGRCMPVSGGEHDAHLVVFIGRDVTQQHRGNRLRDAVHACTSVMAGTASAKEAMRDVLRIVATQLDWAVGEIWRAGPDDRLVCLHKWHAPGLNAEAFLNRSHEMALVRGEGLPGQAWERHEPVWMDDVARDTTFRRRAEAAAAGLHAGFAVPIQVGGRMAGALAFFRKAAGRREDDLLTAMTMLAGQLGQYLDRMDAEAGLIAAKAATDDANRELAEKAGQLEEALDELQHQEDLRDNLVHMVAHDMRSPLFGISGYLEIAIQECEQGDAAAVVPKLRTAFEAARTLARMVTAMLDVSRLKAGRMPLDRVAHNLSDIAQAALNSLGSLTGSHAIVLAPAVGDAVAECDGEIIKRVLANLLGNALKYSPAGGRIEVTFDCTGDPLRVRVRDEGPGVPVEDHGRIFEKFGQSRPSGSRQRSSSGLGLTFCKLAVEAHGGELGVENAPERGSIFWFTLPRQIPPFAVIE